MGRIGRFLSWCSSKLRPKGKPAVAPVEAFEARWTRLDRAITYFFPGLGAERRLARFSIGQLGRAAASVERMIGHREGNPTGRDRPLVARGAAPDWTLEMGWDRRAAVDAARGLERVNSIASSVLDRACEHVIGEGFTLKCKTDDERWNRGSEAYWQEWCRNCDSRGVMTFNEILTLVFRSWLRDGDVGTLLESDSKIRLVESDEIASRLGGYSTPSDADGVELDKRGRIIAFWVFEHDPKILWPDRRTALPRLMRVPVADMIFLARRQRFGQTRGMSAFTGAAWIFESADDALESVAVAHHMAASAGLVLKKRGPVPGNPQRPGNTTRPGEIALGPGKVITIDVGEDVTQIQPAHPGGTFEILLSALIRIAAARFGVSLELVNYDFTNANYSNMRAQSLETALASRIKQRGMITHFATSIWGWVLANAIRTGKLRPRPDAHKHSWRVPGSAWQDPEVELRASMGAVDGIMDTRTNLLARRGLDFHEVAQELADEDEFLRKLGLPEMRSVLTRDALPTTKTITEPDNGSRGEKPRAAKNGAARNGANRLHA